MVARRARWTPRYDATAGLRGSAVRVAPARQPPSPARVPVPPTQPRSHVDQSEETPRLRSDHRRWRRRPPDRHRRARPVEPRRSRAVPAASRSPKQAREISDLYDIVFALAVVIFVAVEGLIVWSILRYRRRPGDVDLPPQTHGNNLVEALWTLIPTVIVLYLFAISWDTLQKVDAISAPAQRDLHVKALAGQFQWQFEYLDAAGNHLATETRPVAGPEGGGMAVPVGKNVYVTLVSGDVIHAWYVPHFLFKRDVVPGQVNHFEFTAGRGRGRRGLPRPVRRAVRHRPPGDALRRARDDTRRLRCLARRADREGERDPAAAARPGHPRSTSPPRTSPSTSAPSRCPPTRRS